MASDQQINGGSIFPHFNIDVPMPADTKPPALGREDLLAEIERLRAALSEIEVQPTDERSRIRATEALEGMPNG